MSRTLTQRSFTIMATCTACRYACVIHRRTSFEAGSVCVTSLTSRCRRNVCRWFSLYIREATTMTSRTTSRYASMVHDSWFEGGG
jgi:hypothetical protein